ncbi:MAG TPA: hypothetical protein PKD53_01485 [Chloroflexaceae bacterium]|nr:hypothetical protein [Chloroflexaceae bacterium]
MIRRLAPLLLAALLLVGCGAEPAAEELIGVGGGSPQQVVESFLEDLNEALAAPLGEPAVRRAWAERLASHFAPSERADQRAAMASMLARFATSAASPAVGSKATLELTWTRIDLLEQDGERARVRVVDGVMTLRFLNGEGEVVRERSGGITDVIGQESGWLPTLRVGGSWFMTEG